MSDGAGVGRGLYEIQLDVAEYYRTNGVDERATGGDMIYLMPGVRLYWNIISAAFGVKTPVWTDLNEEDEQQGGEGTEDYRLIFTLSVLF